MKGYEEHVAAPPFTTNQEELLSLYGFMGGRSGRQSGRLLLRKIDFASCDLGAMPTCVRLATSAISSW